MSNDLLTDHDTIFIDGTFSRASTRDRIEVISPWTEETIATVPGASREDVDAAVSSARRALTSGPWPTGPRPEPNDGVPVSTAEGIDR